jgi:hypothetical protein
MSEPGTLQDKFIAMVMASMSRVDPQQVTACSR